MIAGNSRELIELGIIRPAARPIKIKQTHSFRGSSYKLFKEARSSVRSKGFKSIKEYKQFMYIHGLPGVPDAPDIVYRNSGWKNFNDWIGLKKPKVLKRKKSKRKQKKLAIKANKTNKKVEIKKVTNNPKKGNFNRLLSNRLPRAANSIKLIGNLSNRSAYEYKDDEAKKIIKELKQSLKILNKKFRYGRI